MEPDVAESIHAGIVVNVSTDPSQVTYVTKHSGCSYPWHDGPVFVKLDVQAIGESQGKSGIVTAVVNATFQEKASSDHEYILKPYDSVLCHGSGGDGKH